MYQALDNHFIYLCSSKWSVSSLYGLKADNGIIYVGPRISRISQICWLTFLSSNVRVTVSPGSWQPAGDCYHLSTLMIVKRFPVYTPGAMSESRWHCLLIGFVTLIVWSTVLPELYHHHTGLPSQGSGLGRLYLPTLPWVVCLWCLFVMFVQDRTIKIFPATTSINWRQHPHQQQLALSNLNLHSNLQWVTSSLLLDYFLNQKYSELW